jgi:hypothetical protein
MFSDIFFDVPNTSDKTTSAPEALLICVRVRVCVCVCLCVSRMRLNLHSKEMIRFCSM